MWQAKGNFTPSDKLHSQDLNNLHFDDTQWGGDVNGGGYTLSNVHLAGVLPLAATAVTSVFGRIGDVIAVAGDYTAAQIGAVPIARQIITPAGSGLSGGGPLSADVTLLAAVKSVFGRTGDVLLTNPDIVAAGGVPANRTILGDTTITGGGDLTANRTLVVAPDKTNQRIQVMSGGSPVGSPRPSLNFVSGTGALVTVQEISASNRIDVTVASTGGTGGGFIDPTTTTGDLIVRGLNPPATRLAVGADGQVLTADHLQPLGVKWAVAPSNQVSTVFGRTGAIVAIAGDYTVAQITNAVDSTSAYNNPPWIASLPWTKITNPPAFLIDPTGAKGDLIVHGATTTKLPVGSDGSILTADSSVGMGVRWGALAVTSVFGRGGAVVAQGGDYTVAQVTGAVATTRLINTAAGSGLTGGGNLSADLNLSAVADSINQQIQVLNAATIIGTRHAINFISGTGVALTIADDNVNNRINLTVSSSGGSGGGMADPTSAKGDLIVRGPAAPPQALPVGANGQVLTADNAQVLGVKWATPAAASGSQTPWIQDVSAAGFALGSVKGIGVGSPAVPGAHVYVIPTGTNESFVAASNSTIAYASASVANDLGDYCRIRSYGSAFATNPGMAALEASQILRVLSKGAETMRLTTGRVLIKTTADDGINILQVNGTVKSLTGGYVFPDGSTQTTAYTSASSPVTSVFTRTGAVIAVAGDYTAALVTNAVDSSSTYSNPVWITSLAWSKITGAPALLVDPTTAKGDIIARGVAGPAPRLGVGTDNFVLTADSAQPLGIKWAAGSGQTPWLSDINAAGNQLNNLGGVVITGTFDAGNVASSFGLDHSGAYGRLVSWGADTVTNGSFMFVSLRSDGSGTTVPMVVAASAVGIGLTSPLATLHVRSATNQNLQIGSMTWLLANAVGFNAVNDANNAGIPMAYGASVHAFSGGNVGIGTLSPYAKLDIQGPQNATGGISIATSTNDPSVYGYQIYRDANGLLALIGNQSGTGGFVFGNPTERMRIAGTGNIGVGTSSPGATLEVVNNGGVANTFMVTATNSGAAMPPTINVNGSARLVVNCNASGGQGELNIINANLGAQGSGGIWFGQMTSSSTLLNTMVISKTGNVGIGTTQPGSLLTVLPSATPTTIAASNQIAICDPTNNPGWRLSIGFGVVTSSDWAGVIQTTAGSAGHPLLLNPSGGNVGIAMNPPAYALDVGGDVRASNKVYGGTLSNASAALHISENIAPAGTFPVQTLSFTYNTGAHSLTFYVKGSDGVLHNVTLAMS